MCAIAHTEDKIDTVTVLGSETTGRTEDTPPSGFAEECHGCRGRVEHSAPMAPLCRACFRRTPKHLQVALRLVLKALQRDVGTPAWSGHLQAFENLTQQLTKVLNE